MPDELPSLDKNIPLQDKPDLGPAGKYSTGPSLQDKLPQLDGDIKNHEPSESNVTGNLHVSAANVDDIRTAIGHLKSALVDLAEAHAHCEVLTRIKGPGLEPASQEYANSANLNGQKHQDANLALSMNISEEISRLEKSLKQILGTEDVNVENFRKQNET